MVFDTAAMAPAGPKMASRCLQDGPRCPQEGPRWLQGRPRRPERPTGRRKRPPRGSPGRPAEGEISPCLKMLEGCWRFPNVRPPD
eukprot:4538659-Pyramimonas_sp.AAC.1